MTTITASMVKELREKTGAGMLDCKNALAEADGDMENAVDELRKRGQAIATKKGGRATREGLIFAKLDGAAPHSVLLILDATTGQNAHSQVQVFADMVHVTGLIVTKLDGSSKGGVLVSLAEKFGLPVHAIGVGEQIGDLSQFEAADFANSLLDVDGGAGAFKP